jgi:hypothetical protein
MRDTMISNIYNPSEYLKEMADEETGKDEREPHQLELPTEARGMSEAEVIALFTTQQKEIVELKEKLDEVYALINKVWGAR